MVDMNHVHGLEKFFGSGSISQREIIACVREGQARASNDAWIFILMFNVAKGEHVYLVSCFFECALVDLDIICDSAYIGFIGVCHHSDSHGCMVRHRGGDVKKDE